MASKHKIFSWSTGEQLVAAGNGLFAHRACAPATILFAIPASAMMNKMTLKPHYLPQTRVIKALTATQLISMHLFLWRPEADEDSADPHFGPYISILPRNFDSHPLTWLLRPKLGGGTDTTAQHDSLLQGLPPSVLVALHKLHTRFWEDWSKVQIFFRKTPGSMAAKASKPLSFLGTPDATMDFLWAWLNVNTRCIYYRLKPLKMDPDNLTMCPILDFANHTPLRPQMTLVPSKADVWNAAPVKSIGDGLKFISAEAAMIQEGDEIHLTYGSHSNKTLFVEYGFVNACHEYESHLSGEVDVEDVVDELVFQDLPLGELIKDVLVAEGYWGNWTLHSTSDSAQPSWRLITALRLHHLVVEIGSTEDDDIQVWRDVVAGKLERISDDNERAWRETVILMCDLLISRAEHSIVSGSLEDTIRDNTWIQWMQENVRALWREELFVAKAVKQSILRGDEF
ncbi:SET domain-containing protein [Paxillus ammoniavirescens]|nr:SET domain-containing protein [Paxillus ammoniavirescens]